MPPSGLRAVEKQGQSAYGKVQSREGAQHQKCKYTHTHAPCQKSKHLVHAEDARFLLVWVSPLAQELLSDATVLRVGVHEQPVVQRVSRVEPFVSEIQQQRKIHEEEEK